MAQQVKYRVHCPFGPPTDFLELTDVPPPLSVTSNGTEYPLELVEQPDFSLPGCYVLGYHYPGTQDTYVFEDSKYKQCKTVDIFEVKPSTDLPIKDNKEARGSKDIMPLSETGSDDENTSEDSEVGIKKAPTVTKRRPSDASILSSEEEPAPPQKIKKVSPTTAATGKRIKYTQQEGRAIIDHILESPNRVAVQGTTFWKGIEKKGIFHNRTWESLKAHYLTVVQHQLIRYLVAGESYGQLSRAIKNKTNGLAETNIPTSKSQSIRKFTISTDSSQALEQNNSACTGNPNQPAQTNEVSQQIKTSPTPGSSGTEQPPNITSSFKTEFHDAVTTIAKCYDSPNPNLQNMARAAFGSVTFFGNFLKLMNNQCSCQENPNQQEGS